MSSNMRFMIVAIVLGAAVGVAVTVIQGNPIWVGVGAAIGIAVGLVFSDQRLRRS
jgi:hypothetical protein